VRFLGLSNSKISEVINDVSVNTEVWNSVVDLVTEWLLLMLVLGASSRRADWIGTLTDIRIELNSKSPVVTEVGLGIGQVLVGGDNITIELRSEVVIDILGWVVPFGLGSISSKSKLVRFHTLGSGERSVVINDVSVNTEVWNSIVDLVTEWLLLVLVLGAASRGADWVRIKFDISIKLDIIDNPSVSKILLSVFKVLHGGNNISLQGWVEIVINILGWVVPLFLRGSSSDLEFMTDHAFSSCERSEVVIDIMISTEVWYSIVDLVTESLLLVLVLGATG